MELSAKGLYFMYNIRQVLISTSVKEMSHYFETFLVKSRNLDDNAIPDIPAAPILCNTEQRLPVATYPPYKAIYAAAQVPLTIPPTPKPIIRTIQTIIVPPVIITKKRQIKRNIAIPMPL
ncbi:16258_t:CDS:2 [Entrophospora sp. SA101]|nr:8851_t:CDS:2 [Entrophospora sp. SA101]CAJ0645900.1 10795_t:CDS:2 [Entrophospora sp. SA101]CAJ0757992.1 16258_t:CDS:2 [Entrophospora sp. SA101]CAJ0827753.1 5367_t:CDS:2 [Entrophospora sp. SA101]CAJ0865106.1 6001_t:CDS:2 [Entrophospora sp. SA101]